MPRTSQYGHALFVTLFVELSNGYLGKDNAFRITVVTLHQWFGTTSSSIFF